MKTKATKPKKSEKVTKETVEATFTYEWQMELCVACIGQDLTISGTVLMTEYIREGAKNMACMREAMLGQRLEEGKETKS